MIPILVRQRCDIQLISIGPPVGHMAVQKRYEGISMTSFNQVRDFVQHQIADAFRRLLDEFQIQPDAVSGGVARAPLRFHALDADGGRFNAQPGGPFDCQGLSAFPQQFPLPTLDHTLTKFPVTFLRYRQFEAAVAG